MTTPHLLLLCILAGVALYILYHLIALLRQGLLRAREMGLQRESSRRQDDLDGNSAGNSVKWKEMNPSARTQSHLLERGQQFLKHWTSLLHRLDTITLKSASMHNDAVMDPLDGTVFEPHEAVVRCSCGTVYHADSWQWIGEKNGAKCVNCKKVGLVAYGCAGDLTAGASSLRR